MEFKLAKAVLTTFPADVVVIGCSVGKLKKGDGGVALDQTLGGEIKHLIANEGFTGELGHTRFVPTFGKIPARTILLVGFGGERLNVEVLKTIGAAISKRAEEMRARRIAIVLEREALGGLPQPTRLQAVIEGMIMGAYRFDRYREKKTPRHQVAEVAFLTANINRPLQQAIETGSAVGHAICFTRDLVNTPANDLTPTKLAAEARHVAADTKLTCEVWGPAEMKKERMGALLAVTQGTVEPPVFIHLAYRPRRKTKTRVTIVGKGVTFDSGGLSLKQPLGMGEMKYDMAGAAVALATITVAARLQLAVAIDVYIPSVENLPDGRAYKPGDIVRARNGKTIEVITTDAEGRLLLADALSYAADRQPTYLIDIATLTGGASIALGEIYAALFGNDQRLVDRIRAAAARTGERVWQLPLEQRYLKEITKGPADLANSGGSKASTISAALFLSQFVGETKWAHLDIAPCAWANEETMLCPRGATGTMVSTLVSFLGSLGR